MVRAVVARKLLDRQVQERLAAVCRDRGLGTHTPHRRPQPTVQLDDDEARRERLLPRGGRRVGDRREGSVDDARRGRKERRGKGTATTMTTATTATTSVMKKEGKEMSEREKREKEKEKEKRKKKKEKRKEKGERRKEKWRKRRKRKEAER